VPEDTLVQLYQEPIHDSKVSVLVPSLTLYFEPLSGSGKEESITVFGQSSLASALLWSSWGAPLALVAKQQSHYVERYLQALSMLAFSSRGGYLLLRELPHFFKQNTLGCLVGAFLIGGDLEVSAILAQRQAGKYVTRVILHFPVVKQAQYDEGGLTGELEIRDVEMSVMFQGLFKTPSRSPATFKPAGSPISDYYRLVCVESSLFSSLWYKPAVVTTAETAALQKILRSLADGFSGALQSEITVPIRFFKSIFFPQQARRLDVVTDALVETALSKGTKDFLLAGKFSAISFGTEKGFGLFKLKDVEGLLADEKNQEALDTQIPAISPGKMSVSADKTAIPGTKSYQEGKDALAGPSRFPIFFTRSAVKVLEYREIFAQISPDFEKTSSSFFILRLEASQAARLTPGRVLHFIILPRMLYVKLFIVSAAVLYYKVTESPIGEMEVIGLEIKRELLSEVVDYETLESISKAFEKELTEEGS